MGLGEARLESHGLSEFGDGLVQLALVQQRVAEVKVNGGVLRPEPDRFAETGDGAVVVPFLVAQRRTKVVEGAFIVRLEAEGLLEGGYGLLRLTLRLKGHRHPMVGPGVVPLEAEGLVALGDGLVRLPVAT